MSFGDIASITTLVMFVVFIIGKLVTTRRLLSRRFDKVEVLDVSEEELEEYRDLDNFIDLGGLQLVKLTSQVKIEKIDIYDIEYYDHSGDESKYRSKLIKGSDSIEPHECLYLYLELGECMPKFKIEIKYLDNSIATFLLSEDRRNGSVFKEKYRVKVGFNTFFHYLFT